MTTNRRRAVFLDRDGVINDLAPDPRTGLPESPYDPAAVRILPDVGPALAELRAVGFLPMVVSNQPGAAKGYVDESALDAVHQRVVALLGPYAGEIVAWRYCRHHPEAIDPQLRDCDCRKPKPGMLLELATEHDVALADSWMIGDSDRDIEAGIAAGCRTVLIRHPGSGHRRGGAVSADLQARDLHDAAAAVLRNAR